MAAFGICLDLTQQQDATSCDPLTELTNTGGRYSTCKRRPLKCVFVRLVVVNTHTHPITADVVEFTD